MSSLPESFDVRVERVQRSFRGVAFLLEFEIHAGGCDTRAYPQPPREASAVPGPHEPAARLNVTPDGVAHVQVEPFRFHNPVALTALAEVLAYLHAQGLQRIARSR